MSPFPANNIHQCNEPIATDTVHVDTHAIDAGFRCAQLFVRTESLVSDVYGLKTEKQFVNTSEDTYIEVVHQPGYSVTELK